MSKHTTPTNLYPADWRCFMGVNPALGTIRDKMDITILAKI